MSERPSDSPVWRSVHGVAILMVLAFFLFSLRGILNPVVLFLLLVLLLSPYAGTRYHLLVVSSSAVLMGLWLLDTTGFLPAPFFLALVLAYVFHPAVGALERRRVPRALAILLLFVPLLLLLGLGVGVGIPLLSQQVAAFIQKVPALIQTVVGWVEGWQRQLARQDLPFIDEEALLARVRGIQPEAVLAQLQTRQAELARRVWQAVLGAGRGVGTVLTVLSYVFLTPILTFYLLRDYNGITGRLHALLPVPQRGWLLAFAAEYDRLLSRYLRGQLLAAAIVGVLTWLGFALLGFPYALLLGVVAGVFNVVPYLGLIASLIPALIIALFSGEVLWSLGKIGIVFAVVQMLDSTVVGPKIVGESVGLHPVWVILALAVAGAFWGFVGLLLAIPLAVLLKLLLAATLEHYRRSRLFRGAGAEPPVAPAAEAGA